MTNSDSPSESNSSTSEPIGENDGESNSDESDEFTLEVNLPDDSLFDLEDYLEMYEIASKTKPFTILTALARENRLSTSELSQELDANGNNLHYPLRRLSEVGLIRNRRDPNTGTEETYSYYELTDLGHTVLTQGIAVGVKTLAEQEASIEETYSE